MSSNEPTSTEDDMISAGLQCSAAVGRSDQPVN